MSNFLTVSKFAGLRCNLLTNNDAGVRRSTMTVVPKASHTFEFYLVPCKRFSPKLPVLVKVADLLYFVAE